MNKKKKISSSLLLLVLGLATTYLGSQSLPGVSADTTSIDPAAITQFKIVFIAGIILVIVSFVFLALASISTQEK